MNSKQLGQWGEQRAVLYLKQKGFKILYTNYRTRTGEIDIIAEDSGAIVFVEVKTRRTRSFGLPRESVNSGKVYKSLKTALHYLNETGQYHKDYRFDIVEIYMQSQHDIRINHIINAFQPDSGQYYF